MTFAANGGKTEKWQTHLAITTDAIMAYVSSNQNTHTFNATIFDSHDTAHDAKLHMWTRIQPEDGSYILRSVPCGTHPLEANVNINDSIRQIPDEFDGLGVVESADVDKKGCYITGLVYLGKERGWVKYKKRATFEDTKLWENWFVPNVGSLVDFETTYAGHDDDGTPECIIRRLANVADAPRPLLQALAIGQHSPSDKAAKLREIRANKKTRTDDNATEPTATQTSGPSRLEDTTSATNAEPKVLSAPTTTGKKARHH
ncbi:hypothetical protein CF319_g4472 [Tilletia indica]|nr:hypothetical protein CF319_g4472 [Tilletia indica]